MFEPFHQLGKNLASPPQWEGIARSLKQTDDVVTGGRADKFADFALFTGVPSTQLA